MVKTISEPSADQKQKTIYNKHMRAGANVTLDPEEKLAVCLLRLHPAVTPADYARLKAAVEAVTGIELIALLDDAQAPASLPADR